MSIVNEALAHLRILIVLADGVSSITFVDALSEKYSS